LSKGFITLPLAAWGAIAAGAVMVAMGVGLKIQTSRLETCQTEFRTFKLETKRIGEAAQKDADAKEARAIKDKEIADARHKNTIARLNRDLKRLRDDNASRRFVSAATPDSRSPQIACYGRERLNAEVRGFVEEATDVLAELGTAAVELNTAKEWAAKIE